MPAATLAPKLLRSYALDALDPGRNRRASGVTDVPTLLARLRTASGTTVPAVAEGEDVKLSGPDVAGAALVARGKPSADEAGAADETDVGLLYRLDHQGLHAALVYLFAVDGDLFGGFLFELGVRLRVLVVL